MAEENFKMKLLNANNWHQWCVDIKVLLMERACWSFIDETEPELDLKTAKRKEILDFNTRKSRAYSTIYYGIQPEYRNLINSTVDGKKAFDTLKEYFEPKTKARTIALLDEFFSLRFNPKEETIGLFCAKLKACVQRLAEANHPIEDIYQGFQLIRYLPQEYNGIVQIIYRWSDADFKFDKIERELILEENRLSQLQKDANNMNNEHGAYWVKKSSQGKNLVNKPNLVKTKSFNKNQKKGKCYKCNAKGHYSNECPKTKRVNNEKVAAPNAEVFYNRVENVQDKFNWCLDSGATHHFSNNLELFTNYQKLKNTKMVLAVGDAESTVEGTGIIQFTVKNSDKIIILKDVMYSPKLRRNLLSMSKIDEAGGRFEGTDGKMWVINKKNEKLFYAKKDKGLYILKPTYKQNCDILTSTNIENVLCNRNYTDITCSKNVSTKSSDSKQVVKTKLKPKKTRKKEITDSQKVNNVDLWHKRFSHTNKTYLIKTSKNNSVRGLPVLTKQLKDCESCKLAKTRRKSFKSIGGIRSTKPLELLHMDLCGKMPVESHNGSNYFLTITDDFSRKVTVFPIKKKSDVFDTFVRYQKRAENFLDLKIKSIRTDCGLEFGHAEFSKFLNEKGIKHERTNIYTPEQDGVSERYNLTVLDGVKAMLNCSGLNNEFWAEAVMCFTYTWNRVCHSGQIKTPHELYCGKKPSVAHLRTFGCLTYVGVPKQKRNKLDMHAKKGIMVGYAQSTKGYRIWMIDEAKIVETINVSFSENELVGGSDLGLENKKNDYLVFKYDDICSSSDEEQEIPDKIALTPCTAVEWVRELVPRPDGSRTDVYYRTGKTRLRTVKEIEKFCKENNISYINDYFDFSAKNKFEGKIEPITSHLTTPVQKIELNNAELKIPISFTEAVNSPEKNHWLDAMKSELSVIEERHVWDLVPPPKNEKILGNRWVFTIKNNDKGEVTRFKARLVAKGFNQVYGESYEEVFSPVVNFTLIRLFFSILVCTLGWLNCQLDIKNAYLYASLSNNIYMAQPQGFEDPNRKNHVCHLKKALYGLHQSSREFFFELDKKLSDLNFKKLKWSNCIYVYNKEILLLVYVDDIVVFGKTQTDVDQAIGLLSSKFDIKILGKTTKLLGIEFEDSNGNLYLHQQQYITKICKMYSEYTCTMSSLPIVRGQIISKTDCPVTMVEKNKMSETPYRNLLGCLSFLASRTRPDICYAVNILSQFQENPGEKHWQMLLKLLGYIRYTSKYKLKLVKINDMSLNCFSDADFAANRDDRVSIGGMFFQVDTSPISWRTFKQKCVSLSTMESEYISLTEACKELIWIINILKECKNLGINVERANLMCDNMSAIDFSSSPIENNRTKHIDVRYHFIRENVYKKIFDLKYIKSCNNMADIFTKPLNKHGLLKFCNLVFVN